jgi:hypothetical protein
MTRHLRCRIGALTGLLGLVFVLAACLSLSCASTTLAEPHLRGLDLRGITTHADCASQPRGHARCASDRLIYQATGEPVRSVGDVSPSTTANPALTPAGYGPGELQSAYNLAALTASRGAGETIAVVDAFDDPNAASDLDAYRSHYGLAPCTAGCFTKVEQSGTKPSSTEDDWSLEVSLDLDMASAICPKCDLLLEEASSDSLNALAAATHTAATTPGVVAVSNSYDADESEIFPALSSHERSLYESDYTQPGVAITAAAGDTGYEVNFPAVLSSVTAVGGTSLELNSGVWSETAWSLSCANGECTGTGGGCSEYVSKPAWQTALGSADSGCSKRTDNDVSADADPNTGAAVYDTDNNNGGWNVVGGTSEAAPIVAGFYALIGEKAGVDGASWDYEHPSNFEDVVGGSDQSGCSSYLCEAILGYDGPTGLGTPDGTEASKVGEAPAKGGEPGEPKSKPTEEPGKSEESSKGGGSEGSSGGGTGEGSKGSGESPGEGAGSQPDGGGSASSSTSGGSSSTPSGPPGKSSTITQAIRVVALALTANARAALHRDRLTVAQLAFSFTLNQAATVRVTLARRIGSGAHAHWRALPASLAFAAIKGINRRRLHGSGGLAPGTYRLTLTPSGGRARSLTIRVS